MVDGDIEVDLDGDDWSSDPKTKQTKFAGNVMGDVKSTSTQHNQQGKKRGFAETAPVELGNDAIQEWKIWWAGIFKVGD